MSSFLSQQAAHNARNSRGSPYNTSAQSTDIYVLNSHEMIELWKAEQRSKGRAPSQIETDFKMLTGAELVLQAGSNYGSAAMDIKVLTALALDMRRSGSILGQYYTTTRDGRNYLVFKGNQRLRKVVTGTRYLATNTKMIQMCVGGKALQASARGGFLVSVLFSTTQCNGSSRRSTVGRIG